MRRGLLNFVCILVAVIAGVQLFVLKYQVMRKEKELAQIHQAILGDKREIHMLKADWAVLNDPERLRALVQSQTALKPIHAHQIIPVADIPLRPAPAPDRKPEFDAEEAE